MADCKRGKSTLLPGRPVYLASWASAAGKKEAEGPLGPFFDYTDTDTYFGKKTWEDAERFLQETALNRVLRKAGLHSEDCELVLSGDLLNQCISSSFALRNRDLPWLGLYGACSNMAEGLAAGAMAVGGGFADRVVAMTSSHFAAAERQYRFPLNYGGQRTPTAQWTVTGAGAVLLSALDKGPRLEAATIGTVCDLGITDSNNMGAAMAPAAVETISRHLKDMNRSPEDYDLIVTGDLGAIGKAIVQDLLARDGLELSGRYEDCGVMIFDREGQDVHAGGSGCGCSAAVLCSVLLGRLSRGEIRRLLFCGTGALLSPTSAQQGQSIPGVCHAVSILGKGAEQ